MRSSGTAATTPVDLHPVGGYLRSRAVAAVAAQQVGSTWVEDYVSHAALWSGSADDYIDLHAFLPAQFHSSSAHDIIGNTIYGLADDGVAKHAVTWTVPEPGGIGVIGLAACAIALRKHGLRGRTTSSSAR